MTSQQRLSWAAVIAAAVAPLAVAGALVPLRATIDTTNVALVLAAVVVAIGALGRRLAVVIAAVSSAVWFDFFHTTPYQSFAVDHQRDIVTVSVLLAVGLVVGEIAIRARHHKAVAALNRDDIARIHSVTSLIAEGEPADFVVMAVANELRYLLRLQDCRFEPAPVGPDPRPLARLERTGEVVLGDLSWGADTMGLPAKGVNLPIESNGALLGRFVLQPTPAAPVSLDRRVVAVAMADQVGVALAGGGVTRG